MSAIGILPIAGMGLRVSSYCRPLTCPGLFFIPRVTTVVAGLVVEQRFWGLNFFHGAKLRIISPRAPLFRHLVQRFPSVCASLRLAPAPPPFERARAGL